MPEPIRSPGCTNDLDIAPEELESGMCLTAAPPSTASKAGTPLEAPSPPEAAQSSPAVSGLVARFYEPSAHPPLEPSLAEAVMNCKAATAAYVATAGAAVLAAPDTFGASFVLGALRIEASGAALLSCLEQNENKQLSEARVANLATDCRAGGAIPLTTGDGKVVCERP
jgi:hypothetical protein